MDDELYLTKLEKYHEFLEDFIKTQDSRALKMITIIFAIMTLELTFLLPKLTIGLTKYVCTISIVFYLLSSFCFVSVLVSEDLKLFPSPNLIIKCYNSNISKKEYISIFIDRYNIILHHNKKIMDNKTKRLTIGFYILILGILVTFIALIPMMLII